MPFLPPAFFSRDVLAVARELVGMELVWEGCSGIIVETEAYTVADDPAAHTAFKPSARQFVEASDSGTVYVYFNYGMYWMFNLLVKGGERDGMVLIRALEPVDGLESMQTRRKGHKLENLCSGPGKLVLALGIDGSHHGVQMAGPGRRPHCGFRRPAGAGQYEVVEDVRVGISKAAEFPWRFLAKGNAHVSVPFGKVKAMKRAGLIKKEGGQSGPPLQT
ncbi:MAG: 3-methyladenine glycosylase [Verrucomicrobiaceae bacterium]|nr:3-methyladenine glycosylase [Verrucomicrobiaceae bacterium]